MHTDGAGGAGWAVSCALGSGGLDARFAYAYAYASISNMMVTG